jgi:hypothetical protein
MIASTACPLVIAIDGHFYNAAAYDGGDLESGSAILNHIPLGNSRLQPLRYLSAMLLRELIVAGEAVLVLGDLTNRHDSQGAEHRAISAM